MQLAPRSIEGIRRRRYWLAMTGSMSQAPEGLKVVSYLRRASAEPGMPDDLIGEPVLMMVSVWIGDLADAAGIHEGLWGSAGSVFTGIHTTSFVELQSVNDEMLGAWPVQLHEGRLSR